MGSSFEIIVVDGDDVIGEKFFGTIGNSQHFFYWHSKNMLSQQTTWAITWFNVVRFGMVNNRPSFTLLHNPY